jgi:hypothetical protein
VLHRLGAKELKQEKSPDSTAVGLWRWCRRDESMVVRYVDVDPEGLRYEFTTQFRTSHAFQIPVLVCQQLVVLMFLLSEFSENTENSERLV